jgi:hypothetical protein
MKKSHKPRALDPAYICGTKDPLAGRELLTKISDEWRIFLVLALASPSKTSPTSNCSKIL